MTTREDVRQYIVNWNIRFPIDRWWRKKYTIAFNSSFHRESNFIDQLIEYEEDKLFSEFSEKEEYIPNTGDWIKEKKISIENIEEAIADYRQEFQDTLEDE